jgi:thiol-disulfide isomerase/thioredoxin
MKKSWVSFFILVLISCNQKPANDTIETGKTTATAEEIKLVKSQAQGLDISSYKGKHVFINFWATWCKPCVSEMPSLQRMTEKLKGENIVFLFASDETAEEIAEFRKSNNYNMEFVKIDNLASLNISAIPSTYIYNKNGELVFTETGAREWDSDESLAMITKTIRQ